MSISAEPTTAAQTERTEPFLVVNPNSGGGSTGRRWSKLEAEVKAGLGTIAVGFTTRPLEASEITRKALESGYRTIIAVGGDGTLNEVVNGFFRPDGSAVAPGAAVSLLPAGTGGDFKRTAQIPQRWSEAVRKVAAAPVRPADVGRVTFCAHDGSQAVRYFFNVASCGVSGAVDAAVNRSSKMLGGRLSFMLASLNALRQFRDKRVRFSIDGGAPEEATVTCIALGNGQYFGSGMRVAPEAKLDDGLLSGTIWSGYTVGDFVFRIGSIYSGDHVKWPGTRCFTAKKVVVESGETVLLDIDGEQPGRLPATFEILPGAIGLRA